MHKNLKNLGIFSSGLLINGYLMFHAVKANESYNKYLANLPPEELEKIKAREWFLKKHGRFYGSGIVIAERMELDAYNGKTPREKECILTSYRWDQMRKESSGNRNSR